MTTTKHRTDAELLEDFRVTIENAENQSEIKKTIAEFGYGSEEMTVGKNLLATARKAFDFNNTEDNETDSSKADLDSKLKEITATFKLHRRKAKSVFRNDDVILDLLGVKGTFQRSYVKLLEAMRTFYNGIQSDSALLIKLSVLQVTKKDITIGLSDIIEVESLRSIYLKEIGESQDATQSKDLALGEIEEWIRDFLNVAKIAMEDRPQLLEALGVLVRS